MTAPTCPKCHKPFTYAIDLRGCHYEGCVTDLIATYVGPSPATPPDPDLVATYGTPDGVLITQRAEAVLAMFTLTVPTSKGSPS